MSGAMTVPPDRSRVEKLLGMLGSDFAGERANAAAALSRIARDQRLTLVELLQRIWRGESTFPSTSDVLDLLAAALAAPDAPVALTEWELNFARNIIGRFDRQDELSPKQRETTERIIRKVERFAKVHQGASA